MSSNPFDFNEDEESRKFEKSVIFGVSTGDSDVVAAHDFMQKSLAAANMIYDDEDDGGLDQISNKNEKDSFMFVDRSIGLKQVSLNERSNSVKFTTNPINTSVKYTAKDLSKSARSNSTLKNDFVHHKPQVSASDYQKIQDELNEAKRMIENLRNNLPIKETIRNIVTGKPYRLEGYKSFKDKKQLLDEAIQSKDGNAVLIVVLYMEKTLNSVLLHRELRKRTTACNHYIQYLRQRKSWDTLEAFFKYLLLLEEAALLRYERIRCIKEPKERLEELNKWTKDYGTKPEVSDLAGFIRDEIGLIEKQRQIEEDHKVTQAKIEKNRERSASVHERPKVLLRPLITTISYCAMYHYDKGSKFFPDTLKKQFKITDKQYEWAVLPPLVNRRKWTDIQELLTSTNWLRRKGESSAIGFEYVSAVLYKAKANQEILSKYLSLISNTELRIKYAARYQMHDIVIQSIVDLRDRQRMENYRSKIGGKSSMYQRKITDLLNNTSIKWR